VRAGCARERAVGGDQRGRQSIEAGVYEITRESLKEGPRRIPLIYAKPATVKHPKYLVVFATGDGGWRGLSRAITASAARATK
jgi:type IV secretory pathway VirJ component